MFVRLITVASLAVLAAPVLAEPSGCGWWDPFCIFHHATPTPTPTPTPAHPAQPAHPTPPVATPLPHPSSGSVTGPPVVDSNTDGHFDTGSEVPSLALLESHFGAFERVFANLPTSGKAPTIPWASTYWPAYEDGANNRWAGANTPSPIEKYAQAYKWNAGQLADQISYEHGIDSAKGKSCFSSWSCEDGAECVARRGSGGLFGKKYCVQTWEGICDGWTAAALTMPEPRCPVTQNGVTFTVGDLKGLASSFMSAERGSHINTVSLSARCNSDSTSKDRNGFYSDPTCQDASAGIFHIFVSNMLGRLNKPFAFDRYTTAQVWNQPVYGYTVNSQKDVSRSSAQRTLGSNFRLDSRATRFVSVSLDLNWVTEVSYWDEINLTFKDNANKLKDVLSTTTYDYILFLTDAGEIIGGEWTGSSKNQQPDFFWVPVSVDKTAVAYTALAYTDIEELWTKSVNCQ
ncbi:hypothetical protein HKX48_002159 [Thoreauomyces humboldtii]|nr:hypothetical protein HKX48_002159 [Thoreauomyces humboldtii]